MVQSVVNIVNRVKNSNVSVGLVITRADAPRDAHHDAHTIKLIGEELKEVSVVQDLRSFLSLSRGFRHWPTFLQTAVR